jgi:hypothetical protein
LALGREEKIKVECLGGRKIGHHVLVVSSGTFSGCTIVRIEGRRRWLWWWPLVLKCEFSHPE